MKYKKSTLRHVRKSLVDALHYVNEMRMELLPLARENNPKKIKKIAHKSILKMKLHLPICTMYVVLMILANLSTFAFVESQALNDDVSPRYPRSANSVDYTVKYVWKKWRKEINDNLPAPEIEDEEDQENNPFDNTFEFVSEIVRVIAITEFDTEYVCKREGFS
jgi:hypothetical protein